MHLGQILKQKYAFRIRNYYNVKKSVLVFEQKPQMDSNSGYALHKPHTLTTQLYDDI